MLLFRLLIAPLKMNKRNDGKVELGGRGGIAPTLS
jgi:hypothetical protein